MLKKRQHEIKFHCVYTNVDVVKNPFMPIWSKVFAISSHTSSSSRGFISHSVRKTSTLNDAVNLKQSQHTHTHNYISTIVFELTADYVSMIGGKEGESFKSNS